MFYLFNLALKSSVVPVILSLLLSDSAAFTSQYQSVPTRESVEQPFLLLEPKDPIGTVILFAGGSGIIGLETNGEITGSSNFLVRSREYFAENGFVVIVIEAPSDKQSGFGMRRGFRIGEDHATDIGHVISFIKNKYDLPVWLAGTSRGSTSATNIAIRLPNEVDGLLLSSNVTKANNNDDPHLFSMDLSQVKENVLINHHQDDGCWVTPVEDVSLIVEALTMATNVTTEIHTGGTEEFGVNVCGSQSHHGFLDIEEEVLDSMISYINSRGS